MQFWKPPQEVFNLVDEIINKYHLPRLEEAHICIAFNDSKPFKNDKFNWGKVVRFNQFNQLWQKASYDFCIVLSADVWNDMLNADQRKALIDLHLTRCRVEYEPETVLEGNKKKVVKDEHGRTKYTNTVKVDDSGKPKWKLSKLDLEVFSSNVSRFGLWCEELLDFKDIVVNAA